MWKFSTVVALALISACSAGEGGGFLHLQGEHCRLPTAHELPVGDPSRNEWWLPGPLQVSSTSDWPDCPPLDASTEVGGEPRITYPSNGARVAPGSWPVIVFGHANSESVCNPTDRYRSLHEQWASWGWVVYAVDSSEQNCLPFTASGARARLDGFDEALADLRRRNGDPRSPFFGRLRFDATIAAGHSRGGAAAVAVASTGPDWAGVMTLQGGNPSRFQLGDTYVDVPVLGITSELDTDLRFPHVDLTEALLRGRYSWHTLRRGNHSFSADGLPRRFNDDVDEMLSRTTQLELTKYLTVAFLAANFGVFDGDVFEPQPQAEQVIYSHFGDEYARALLPGSGFISRWDVGPDRDAVAIDCFDSFVDSAVDDEEEEGEDDRRTPASLREDPTTNDLGLPNRCVGLARCEEAWTYSIDEPVAFAGYRLVSSRLLEASGEIGTFAAVTQIDLPRGWHLQAIARANVLPAPDFTLVIVSPDGERRVDGRDATNTVGLEDRFVQLDVPLEETRVDEVRVELRSGALQLDDLRFVAPSD